MFDPSTFDLTAYLRRIGYSGPTTPTLATLTSVAEHHPAAIAFENLDAYLRRPMALDSASLQRKLVHGGRGGWCFEHNLLLGTALTTLGFNVVGLGARVLWNAPRDVVGARSHMVLFIDLDGQRFIVDGGFGGLTLTAPLRLEADLEQPTPHGAFRLRRAESDFVLEAQLPGQWRPLYRFELTPQRLADYEVSNWYLCHHPASIFLAGVMAARSIPGARLALHGCELTTYHTGRASDRRVIASGRELRHLLESTFGINVPPGADVDAALDRLPPPTTQPA